MANICQRWAAGWTCSTTICDSHSISLCYSLSYNTRNNLEAPSFSSYEWMNEKNNSSLHIIHYLKSRPKSVLIKYVELNIRPLNMGPAGCVTVGRSAMLASLQPDAEQTSVCFMSHVVGVKLQTVSGRRLSRCQTEPETLWQLRRLTPSVAAHAGCTQPHTSHKQPELQRPADSPGSGPAHGLVVHREPVLWPEMRLCKLMWNNLLWTSHKGHSLLFSDS